MTRKRKRKQKRPDQPVTERPRKRTKLRGNEKERELEDSWIGRDGIQHPLLSLYYSSVRTLREYLFHKLPESSKSRRRRILSLPLYEEYPCQSASGQLGEQTSDRALSKLLDLTLVGVTGSKPEGTGARLKELASFSQHQTGSTVGSSNGTGVCSQSELVDFTIWLLFNKTFRTVYKPPHLLCHGLRRSSAPRQPNENHDATSGIPGLVCYFPNTYVNSIKSPLWNNVLSLLGKEGERVMIDLLMDCGLFGAVEAGKGNFCQLSGTPLSEMSVLPSLSSKSSEAFIPSLGNKGMAPERLSSQPRTSSDLHPPMAIIFVRNRMLYARAALNGKGDVRFGLRHIHVLNRYPDSMNMDHTMHIMKYIFPRQFRLHNVFTSKVDTRETVQPYKDYTLREEEIARSQRTANVKQKLIKEPIKSKAKVPRRLRGEVVLLISKLQRLHNRCPYNELLKYYCRIHEVDGPSPSDTASKYPPQGLQRHVSTPFTTQACVPIAGTVLPESDAADVPPGKQSFIDFATPSAGVSAFCRAVISHVFPDQLWDSSGAGQENKRVILRNVDRFVHLRRFESLSLHEVTQNIKVTRIPWPGYAKHQDEKVSQSDTYKRLEIFRELIYYLFDSFLIPLIRSNFHVTESNVHRNRIFFFRHDIWRSFSEPSMASLRVSMFEELKTDSARKMLEKRSLGFSQIRLLPKETGVRPIMNLRRRVIKKQNGRDILGRSINSVMTPVYNMLNYERGAQPQKLGSAMFSVGNMHSRLKSFKLRLKNLQCNGQCLYFAKVDVQSCFDTIPQVKIVRLVEKLLSEEEYRISRHAELKPPEVHQYHSAPTVAVKPIRKFIAKARASGDYSPFEQVVETELAQGKKQTVFMETMAQTTQDKEQLLGLLQEHVQQNIVKIGKKFYRQKEGIPQGSILSSLLCNFFYADLEQQCLDFLDPKQSVLLRLIDDFLLITVDRTQARRFLQVMHDGHPAYGVSVNVKKSLANFEVMVNGAKVPRVQNSIDFPYCGNLIDSRTLAISKDRERRNGSTMADSLTVEYSRLPGKTFHRKILNTLKIQSHAMFLDTSFNPLTTVLSNIHQIFIESAMKYYCYIKCLPSPKKPETSILTRTISDLIDLAFVLIQSKRKKPSSPDYVCSVTKPQVNWQVHYH
ncbi:MAG: hypothetical protein M1812_005737 [Candelaria pacifica]|nr:MAG: hypothetical protein M1812_005737 [Candelaria pacifica]